MLVHGHRRRSWRHLGVAGADGWVGVILCEANHAGSRRADWWATERCACCTAVGVALATAVVQVIHAETRRRAHGNRVSVRRHLGHGFIDLGKQERHVALLAATEAGNEVHELIEVVTRTVLKCVLFIWHARHDVCKCASHIKKLLDKTNAVNFHRLLRETGGSRG